MQGACRIFLAGLGASLLGLSVGGDAMAQPQERAAHASLRVRCAGDAVDAEVFIGGQFKGECPVDILLQEGSYELVVVKKLSDTEERRFARTVRLGANTMRSVDVELGQAALNERGRQLQAERQAQEQVRAEAEAARQQAQRQAAEEKARQEAQEQALKQQAEHEAAYAAYLRSVQALRAQRDALVDQWLAREKVARGDSGSPLCPECWAPSPKKALPDAMFAPLPRLPEPVLAWQPRVLDMVRAHNADAPGFFRFPSEAGGPLCEGSERTLRRVAGMPLPEDLSVQEWAAARFNQPMTWRDIRFVPVQMGCTVDGLQGPVVFWAYGVHMRERIASVHHVMVQAVFDKGQLVSPVEIRRRSAGGMNGSYEYIEGGKWDSDLDETVTFGVYEKPWLRPQTLALEWEVVHATVGVIFKTPEILGVSYGGYVPTAGGGARYVGAYRLNGRWVML